MAAGYTSEKCKRGAAPHRRRVKGRLLQPAQMQSEIKLVNASIGDKRIVYLDAWRRFSGA